MDKMKKLPREGVAQHDDGSEIDANTAPTDTEGHRLTNSLPGTGGDFSPRAPSSGGELIDENDVEGHGIANSGPGTGGDFSPRQPRSGGELGDDVDGPNVKLKLK
jgi:hypothetical protein